MAPSSKTFLLLGFMFALGILISSEVSARVLVETASQVDRGDPYPVKGRPSGPITRCTRNRGTACPRPVRPPGCNPYVRECPPTPATPPPPPPKGHHEKPGPGVGAETETGN